MRPQREHVSPLMLVLLATAASVAIALVALDLAAGVAQRRGRCCETEFIDATALGFLWVLYPVLALASAWSWRLAILGVVGVALPQWLAMGEVMDRHAESGWSDGLEVLGYLLPIQTAVVGAVAVLVGSLAGGVLRRRNVPSAPRQSGDRSSA